MTTISLAFSWEYWRRGAPIIALVGLAMTTVILGCYSTYWLRGLDGPEVYEAQVVHNVMILVATIQVVCAPLFVNGSLDRKFTLPASSWSIVGWPLAWGCLTSAAMYLALANIVNLWAQRGWPLWGPALTISATYAFAQTIGWSLRRSPTLMIAAMSSELVLLGFWLRALPTDLRWQSTWNTPTFSETVILLVAITAAYLAAVAAFTHKRRGGRLDLSFVAEAIVAWWENAFARSSRSEGRLFASPARALVWKEWREKGMYLPLLFAAMLIALSLNFVIGWAEDRAPAECLFVLFAVSYFALPLIGLYLGHASPQMTFPIFRATQPVRDATIARAVLLNVFIVLIVSTSVWLAGGSLVIAAACFGKGGLEPLAKLQQLLLEQSLIQRRPLSVPISLGVAGAWTLGANGAWLAIGRKEVLSSLILICPTLLALGIAYVSFLIPEDAKRVVAISLWSVAAMAVALATLAAFLFAAKRGLISLATCAAAFFAWLAINALLCAQLFWDRPPEAPAIAFALMLSGFATLAVAPLAATPLAVAYNRRR